MINFRKTAAAISVAAIALTGLASAPALADDGAKNMRMISVIDVNPAMAKEWGEAWTAVREIAIEKGYPHELHVATHRNRRWFINSIENFAGVDAIFASREEVNEKGGKKFEKALAKLQGAELSARTFFSRYDPELSYSPEGAAGGTSLEIDTFSYRIGKGAEMKALLEDYKQLVESKGIAYGYQVFWNGIGTEGNSVTFVSNGESQLALAQANADFNATFEGDEDLAAIFESFLQISLSSETEHATIKPEMSIIHDQE